MASFDSYVEDNKTGLRLCYCVRVRGLPYQWTTGEGDWSGTGVWDPAGGGASGTNGQYDVTTKHGGLITKDWDFGAELNPTEPLKAGRGVSFDLSDDETGYLRQMISPRYGVSTRQIETVSAFSTAATTSGYAHDPDGAGGTAAKPLAGLDLGSANKLYMMSTSGFTTSSEVHVGTSCYVVDTSGSGIGSDGTGAFIALKNAFGTKGTVHKMKGSGASAAGAVVSTSPRVFKGRWVEVWCAPLKEGRADSSVVDTASAQMLWAGRIASHKITGDRYRISCDPILSALDGNRPTIGAKGRIPADTDEDTPFKGLVLIDTDLTEFCNKLRWFIRVKSTNVVYTPNPPDEEWWSFLDEGYGAIMSPIKVKNPSTGDVTNLTSGWYTIPYLLNAIVNTITTKTYYKATDGSTTGSPTLTDNVSAVYPWPTSSIIFRTTSACEVEIFFPSGLSVGTGAQPRDILSTIVESWHQPGGTGEAGPNWVSLGPSTTSGIESPGELGAKAKSFTYSGHFSIAPFEPFKMPVVLDDSSRPFSADSVRRMYLTGINDVGIPKYGFVKVEVGEEKMYCMLVSVKDFTNMADNQTDKRVQELLLWPVFVSGAGPMQHVGMVNEQGEVRVEEVLAIDGRKGETIVSYENSLNVAEMVLQALLSDGAGNFDPSNWNNLNGGEYNTLWHTHGCAIPDDYVDVDGIINAAKQVDAPHVAAMIVDKSGGLQKEVGALLKAAGMQLCYRRIPGGKFGISAVPISPPVSSQYLRTIDDSKISAYSRPEIDYNERLVINAIRAKNVTGKLVFDMDDVVIVTMMSSISDYGSQKALDITTTSLLAPPSGGYGFSSERFAQVITSSALKWFSVFGNGTYNLTVSMPHVAWVYQVGDNVSLTVSGVDSPTGVNGISAVPGQVISTRHRHGRGADKNEVTLRIALDTAYEFAPSALVSAEATDGGDRKLTLAANRFSDSTAAPVYSTHKDESAQKDIHWFDRAHHGADFKIWAWEEGDYDGGVRRTVSASDLANSKVTIDSDTGLTAPFYITLAEYDQVGTDIGKAYAYIADNSAPPNLGSANDEAKEWIS